MNIKTKNILIEISAAVLILIFLYTGITKIWDNDIFRGILQESPFLQKFAVPISLLLPPAEVVLCILLFFPRYRTWGLALSFLLLIVFTIYLFAMILLKQELPCACGGVIAKMNWYQHLVFNIALTILSGLAWRLNKSRVQIAAISSRESFAQTISGRTSRKPVKKVGTI